MPPRRRPVVETSESVGKTEEQPPPPPRQITELFLRQKPPSFDGLGDPSKAETRIRSLERVFDFLGCTNQERITCVAFKLTGLADFWWETRRKTMTEEELAALTWEDFKNGIYDKYIPRSYRREKEVEFYNLKQGKMSVTEYDRTFCDMSRYAPEQVDTDCMMAEKFRAGLRHEIRMALASHGRLSYTEYLSRALDIEEAMPKEKVAAPAAPILPTPPSQSNYRDKRRWESNRAPYENKRYHSAPLQSQNYGRQAVSHQGEINKGHPNATGAPSIISESAELEAFDGSLVVEMDTCPESVRIIIKEE